MIAAILNSWPILVALSILTYSVSVILQKVVLKDDKSDPVAFAIFSQGLAGIVVLIVALLHGFALSSLLHFWPNLIVATVLYGAGNIFVFRALKIIDASTFTIIFASRALWTIVGALLILGEVYSWPRLIGTGLIIASIVIVSGHKHAQHLAITRGELYALLASVCFGIGFVNDALVVRSADVMTYQAVSLLLTAAGIALVQPRAVRQIRPLLRPDLFSKILFLAILYGLGIALVLLAYQVGHNAAQIAPLDQTTTIVIVLLSIVFLKERAALLRKSIGAIISFIGVLLVG